MGNSNSIRADEFTGVILAHPLEGLPLLSPGGMLLFLLILLVLVFISSRTGIGPWVLLLIVVMGAFLYWS